MKRILVVEDQLNVAKMLKILLEKEGYSVEYSLDPRKGLDAAGDFDMILLDIMMPLMSGREFLAGMKKMGIKTPVIVVSAVGMPQEVERELSSKYPGTGFVSKVRLHEELLGEVRKKMA